MEPLQVVKDSVTKKVWTVTTKKLTSPQISSTNNRILWSLILLVGAVMIFSSLNFSLFTESHILMTIFIISGTLFLLLLSKKTNQGIKSWQFLLSAKLELQKVFWPKRREIIQLTMIVLLIVTIASLIIYFFGILSMNFIQLILAYA